jgi:CRISPR-associated protein Cst1
MYWMLDLDYTGHPLFDVGLAAIVAYAGKERPADLEEKDLGEVADFIERYYTQQPLTSFLTTSLMNSDFTQPAFKDKPERRHDYAKLVARSFGPDVPRSEEVCVFTGKPALGRSLSLKKDKEGREELPPGRAYRQHIPLITGENVINFSPWGEHGLPVSGEALLCLQFFPMGCRKCGGRLLAIHSDNPDILLTAAREALQENEREISKARINGETKLPDASSSAQTLIIETLLDLDLSRLDALSEKQPYSITAYHLTNSGQSSPLDERSPLLKIYHLPMNIVRFLRASNHSDYKSTWNMFVARGRERPKPPKSKQGIQQEEKEGKRDEEPSSYRSRNYFYEDIFRLPEDAHLFVKKYFLSIPRLHESQTDVPHPVTGKRPTGEQKFVPWRFIVLFLEEVMHMDKKRIEDMRKLGDQLAAYVKEFDDKRFFSKFYELQRGDYFRDELLRATKNATSRGKPPLFRYEEFCTVFFTELEDGTLRFDWKLARDLVFIRMLEWLYDHDDKLNEHVSALAQERDSEVAILNNQL